MKKISSIVVSHRPKHYPTGSFFTDTAYGFVNPEKNDGYNLVTSKAIGDLKKGQVSTVRDKKLRSLRGTFCVEADTQSPGTTLRVDCFIPHTKQ